MKQPGRSPKLRQGLRLLLLNWQWVLFLLVVLIGGIILSITSSFLFLFLNDMNASSTLMGLSLTVATISELPVLFFSDRLLRRWSARGLLTFALLITVARSLAYSLIRAPGWVLLIQLLHGATFSAIWVTGVAYANEIAPEGLGATAQGLFSGVYLGLAGVIGGLIGGMLYQNLGASMMFRWAGLIGLGLALPLLLYQYSRTRPSGTFPA